jgi:hypothetical protein
LPQSARKMLPPLFGSGVAVLGAAKMHLHMLA